MTTLDDQAKQTYRHAVVRLGAEWETLAQELSTLATLHGAQRSHRLATIKAELKKLHETFAQLVPPAELINEHVRQLQVQVAQIQALQATRALTK